MDAGYGREQALQAAAGRIGWALEHLGWWHEKVEEWNDVQPRPDGSSRPAGSPPSEAPKPLELIPHDLREVGGWVRCLSCGRSARTPAACQSAWRDFIFTRSSRAATGRKPVSASPYCACKEAMWLRIDGAGGTATTAARRASWRSLCAHLICLHMNSTMASWIIASSSCSPFE